jgi:hypothetical protein
MGQRENPPEHILLLLFMTGLPQNLARKVADPRHNNFNDAVVTSKPIEPYASLKGKGT